MEVGGLHVVENGNGTNSGGRRRLAGRSIFRVRQRGNPVNSISKNHIAYRSSDNHPKTVPQRCFSLRFFIDLPGWRGPPPGPAEPVISAWKCTGKTACPRRP